jgi:5-methylthioribose kinase
LARNLGPILGADLHRLEPFLPARCRRASPKLRLTEANLPDYLAKLGFVGPDEAPAVEPAGDGNINWVRRARLRDGRSWIVKQARAELERFPQYQAPPERSVFEARYWALACEVDDAGICPRILHFDERERVLVLEDLGDAERLDQRLLRGGDGEPAARALGRFLGRVHAATRDPALAARFPNDGMRRLHGDHIFRLPFEAGAFPLEPAVARRARAVQGESFRALARAAYDRYLEPHGALVHGDVQAGNVLLPPVGPKLLDAEIAHVGDPAFDLGTLLAHLFLPAVGAGEPRRALPAAAAAWSAYCDAAGTGAPRFEEAARYAGLELLRRTLGAARVPAVAGAEASLAAVERGERWARRPPADPSGLLD